ncbi:unnamed protein product [Cylindrotheca closterium]|uniref:Anaphase-promoting complex subunit 5 n=1 Tax=Cylindrotheca closterium TaxID=2856 RepID=A0AAD2G1B1_9STRA|nr:unnamed protein product [Cylindrotheca closterium]
MAERPSPNSIAVCSLIALHSDPSSPLHDFQLSQETQNSLTIFLEETASATSDDTSLKFLLYKSRNELGDEITSLLKETLEMAVESIDSLIDLMDSLRAAISEGLVDPSSSHGIFLRGVCLGFEDLSFESIAQLWENLSDCLRKPENTPQIQQEWSRNSLWHPSSSQMERFVRKSCGDFELGHSSLESVLSFESMELQLQSLLQRNPDLCAAYFLRFLNCLRNDERGGAIQALHQYFDQAMVQRKMPKDILQFSAILLAMAHSSFGDAEMSLMATEEAVRVAQQSKDRDASCVAFALGWLFENDYSGTIDRRQLLQRCATRALQGQLRPLVSGANLSLATHLASEETQSFTPLAWMTLLRATTVQTVDGLVNLDRPTHISQVPSEGLESVAKQVMVSAAIWASFNVPALAGISSSMALEYNAHLFKGDVCTAIENISLLSLHGFSFQFLSRDLAGGRCVYSQAILSLIELQKRLGFGFDTLRVPFLHRALLFLLEWSVNRCDLGDARAFSIALDSSIHSGQSNAYQLEIDFGLQRCRQFCREKDWQNARICATRLLDISNYRHLKTHRALVLVNQAVVELEADSKQLVAPLCPLLEALSYCEKHEMHGMHAVALSVLAKVHLRSQRPKHAIAILTSVLPSLQQHEHVLFQAEALLTLSKCHIQLIKLETTNAMNNTAARNAEMRLLQCRSMFEGSRREMHLQSVSWLCQIIFLWDYPACF